MPDTDDDQFVSLDPAQQEQGDDDTEAASERRATRERQAARARAEANQRPAADRTRLDAEEEQERLDEEADESREDELELIAGEEAELAERRRREALIDESTRAQEIAFANRAAEERVDNEKLGAAGQARERVDWHRGHDELDRAAAEPDAPGADALAAEGRAHMRAGRDEYYRSEEAYGRAARAGADEADHRAAAEDQRREVDEAQRPAHEAVRNLPGDAPEAQLPQDRRHLTARGKRNQQKNKPRNPASEWDLDL
ncbi:hypothetical protein [Kribbella solani]|uniref:Uncharacterized protein n=1 Tax=Kribbella solani TaxID=236067 RepID=A0A841DTZ3_9ACTN|nr:hypothetical protein [Kribbella solani]MBB5982052.1 hypothetical protein [Kribbella solani]